MNTELVFYEGLKGSGVVASITYGKSRVIFDFGAPFNPMTQPYDGQVERRAKAWVRDAIRLGQIPAIDGVFSARDLEPSNAILPYEQSNLTTGVIISHLHLDHMSGIGMVHPEIPVYLHREGYQLQMLLNQIGESVGSRDFTPIDLHEPFQIGDIQVTAYFSDHPCAGAVGYLIETPDARVYYSGDVRMHGNRLDTVMEDLEAIAAKQVDVLILDTTTMSLSEADKLPPGPVVPSLEIPQGMVTERQLLDHVLDGLTRSDGLGIFNIYHRDMELIKGLLYIAEQANREIVFEPKTAYIVMNMLNRNPTIFIPDHEMYQENAAGYFSEVTRRASRILSVEEIRSSPGKYFLQNSYEHILELFDLPAHRAKYFHLYGIPLVAGASDHENMLRVLKLTGIEYDGVANLFCYNHAYPNNLLYMAERINARNLIGVHSSHPERLLPKNSQQILPQKGEVFQLTNGNLVKIL